MMRCDANSAIRCILCYGVIGSLICLITGSILVFAFAGFDFMTVGQFTTGNIAGSNMLTAFFVGSSLQRIATFIVAVGVLVLIFIPISRAAATILMFAQQGNRKYVILTTLVLVILALGFFVIGPMETGHGL